MNDIKRVRRHYLATDGLLSAEESSATTTTERNRWAQVRDANDQAYFALIFAQFEDVVNTLCRSLVLRMRTSVQWGRRRSWDVVDVGNLDRFPFMNRVALLTEKGDTDYNTVHSYYRLRCDIDHGVPVSGIAVTTVRDDLIEIAKRMRRKA